MSDGGKTDEVTSATGPDIEADVAVEYLLWGAVLVSGIFAIVAAAGLYSSLSATIDVWVVEQYQPPVRAAFNLVVLCLGVAGVVAALRRL